jgi:malonate-semialdehyde dehydrogenase (acetylating) / methylmalonate-semialdehyde dehydrogenase
MFAMHRLRGCHVSCPLPGRILGFIDEAEAGSARILLDGRSWAAKTPGNWVGPTVILHTNREDRALKEEIFGPVLSVIQVQTWDEALAIENGNPYGNAACIYTTVGAHAQFFQYKFRAAMIGINIGIPVPREPFSFGGLYGTLSKFGDMDITGDGCLEFFTNRRKITSKWSFPSGPLVGPTTVQVAPTENGEADQTDRANFNGRM